MCETLRFSNSVPLSCSTFTIRGYLTMNKYNTNGEIINTICLNLLVSSRFGKHYRSCTCLRISFHFQQLQICFTQAVIIIADTVSQHHPSPRATKAALPTTHEHDKEWRALEEATTVRGSRWGIYQLKCGAGRQWWHDRTMERLWGCQWLQSAILSQRDGKYCP